MDETKILTNEEVLKSLGGLAGWTYMDDKISKEFLFPDFQDIISFIQMLTPHFQKEDHHPDIHIYYTKAVFELHTSNAGNKVTPRDIEMAKYIEGKYEEAKASM